MIVKLVGTDDKGVSSLDEVGVGFGDPGPTTNFFSLINKKKVSKFPVFFTTKLLSTGPARR